LAHDLFLSTPLFAALGTDVVASAVSPILQNKRRQKNQKILGNLNASALEAGLTGLSDQSTVNKPKIGGLQDLTECG
jgi:hypothetical protein